MRDAVGPWLAAPGRKVPRVSRLAERTALAEVAASAQPAALGGSGGAVPSHGGCMAAVHRCGWRRQLTARHLLCPAVPRRCVARERSGSTRSPDPASASPEKGGRVTGNASAASTRRRGLALGVRDQWPWRRVGAALLAATIFGLAVGIPTGVVATPFYTRMTPVLWWNYPVWAVTSVLGGLVVATYIRRPGDTAAGNGAAAASGGGLLTAFAVGCPVCNKLVVATLGVSGAMTIWAPLQPLIAILTVGGLLWVLRRRLRNEYACSVAATGRRETTPPEAPRSAAWAGGLGAAIPEPSRTVGSTERDPLATN